LPRVVSRDDHPFPIGRLLFHERRHKGHQIARRQQVFDFIEARIILRSGPWPRPTRLGSREPSPLCGRANVIKNPPSTLARSQHLVLHCRPKYRR
jgi:hypothetical protein